MPAIAARSLGNSARKLGPGLLLGKTHYRLVLSWTVSLRFLPITHSGLTFSAALSFASSSVT